MKIANIARTTVLSLVGLSLLACGDEEFTTTVSGQVINFGSREPIEGVSVYLKDGVGTSGFGIDSKTSSDKRNETVTDANGEFTVSLTGEYEAFLALGKEGYQEYVNEAAQQGIKSYGFGGNYENQVFELKAEAGFNPLFESTVPVQPTDSLVAIYQDTRPDLPADQLKNFTNSGWDYLYVGQQTSRFVSTVTPEELEVRRVAPAVGDTYTPYQIAYTRNGRWETKIDSVYIKSLETYTETIYY